MSNGLSSLFARIGPKLAGIVLEQQAADDSAPSAEDGVQAVAELLPVSGAEVWFVVDADGRFAAASPALLTLSGQREEDLLGKPYTDVVVDLRQVLAYGGSGLVSVRAGKAGMCLAELYVSTDDGGGGGPLRVGVLTRPRDRTLTLGCGVPPLTPDSLPAAPAPQPARPSAEGGSVETIDLDEVRAALGVRWPLQAERVKAIARAIIGKRLTAADVFADADGDRFIICFASLSADAARVKASLIGREIHERLLGARSELLASPASAALRADAQAAPRRDRPIVDALSRHLDAVCAEGRRTAAKAISELLSAIDLMLSPVLTRTLEPTRLVAARLGGEWPGGEWPGGGWPGGGWLGGEWLGGERLPVPSQNDRCDGDPKLAYEMDALLLTLVLKHIYRSLAEGVSTSVIVPVNATTLRERRFSQGYIGLCRSIDQPARSRILFELHGLPPDIAPSRLEQFLSCLAPFSARRIVRVTDPQCRLGSVGRARQTMLSLPAGRPAEDAGAARAFDALAAAVRGGSRLWVRDAGDAEAAAWYGARGADFINVHWHPLQADPPGQQACAGVDPRGAGAS